MTTQAASLVSSVSLALVLGFSASCASGARVTDVSANEPVAVVELFTSEGCSSCPPADDMLRRIQLTHVSGHLILGISEHVTYWNQLGWKDPYSDETFTERQESYANRLSSEGPYTPQMVVNGHTEFVGGNGAALQRALTRDAMQAQGELQILSHAQDRNHLNFHFAFKPPQDRAFDIIAVVTDDADRSSVARGENAGRTLQHVSVARSLTKVASARGVADQAAQITLPENGPSAAPRHLILLAQQPNQGRIVAAVAIPL